MRMTRQEARDLEAKLTVDKVSIRQEGTIRITDTESGTTEIQLLYSAADILQYLNRGYSMKKVLEILNKQKARD